jgi:phenylacetate-coenzyme A ligase PaaK-like adenylate-forming protein
MSEIVAGLNEMQPTALTGYASMLLALAHEAKAGRPRIAPTTAGPSAELVGSCQRSAAMVGVESVVANGLVVTLPPAPLHA